MTTLETTVDTATVERIRVPAWAWLLAAASALAAYALTMDNGLALAQTAETVHELFHDARHFVGAPCH